MSQESRLKQLQYDVEGLLDSCDFFGDITIVTEDRADFENTIKKALAPIAVKGGKAGLAVVVEEPEATSDTEIPAPYMTKVKLRVVVLENMLFNRSSSVGTNKSRFFVAEVIHGLLWAINMNGNAEGAMWPASPSIRSIGVVNDEPSIMGVEILFEAHIPLLAVARVDDPSITNDPNTGVEIACATPDAYVYYSVDGSFPNITYTVPIPNLSNGTLVRARASKSACATSNIIAYIVENP